MTDEVALDPKQQAAVRRMMSAVVERDERQVASILSREHSPDLYAAPADDFWMWADNYGEEPLKLTMPPGDVDEWGIWGFPLKDSPDVLVLHVEVWADSGQTDLTIRFDLAPEGDDYRVRLHDMHVM